MKKFAITGVAGYVAQRHLKAIKDTGNQLVAALDPHDSVGILDSYFPATDFFKENERFERHLEKLRINNSTKSDFLTVCSPNFLHDSHIRLGLHIGADVICEKPLVLNPDNLDSIKLLEEVSGKKVYTVMQLRYHPSIVDLKKKIDAIKFRTKPIVELTYITSRGKWYFYSWKGDEEKSGGIATNIGIHLFDLLIWLFGDVSFSKVFLSEKSRMSGLLELKKANVVWYLSVDENDLPMQIRRNGKQTYRSIKLNNEEVEFTEGFSELHTKVYKEILNGNGLGIDDAYPSIEAVYKIRFDKPKPSGELFHPQLRGKNL